MRTKIAGFIVLLGAVFLLSGVISYFFNIYGYNKISSTCLVVFDADGGTVDIKKKRVDIDGEYGELPVPVKEGYTFDGWFTAKEDGEKIEENSKVTNSDNHVLYARWTYNIYDLEPIVSVNTTSKEDGEYFGGLYSSSKYKGEKKTEFADDNTYGDNNGLLQYGTDGALLLDSDNAIAILDVDKKYLVADKYSLSTTIYGDYTQGGGSIAGDYANTVVAISGTMSHYLCWIGVYKNYLHVYSYIVSNPRYATNYPLSERGFTSIDISQYTGQTININVIGVRDKKTKVYINNTLASEFASGSDELTYEHLVLGDLRPGRNLKFTGKIYDFAIFDKELTEDQVASNYENSKVYTNK